MEYFIWNMNPILLELGPIKIYWYGLFFVGSFFIGLEIFKWIYRRESRDPNILDNLVIYVLLGAAIGARLVHCFFYEPSYFLEQPLKIFAIWEGGLASHGGMLGVLITVWIFTKYHKESYLWLLARFTIVGSLTATAIRLGNFINSEIIGLPSELPWAIVFQRVDNIPRHPVQLYEAIAYISIFILLLTLYKKSTPTVATKLLPPLFLVTLFSSRFVIEYAKTRQAIYSTDLPFSIGQMLSIPFIIIGIVWLIFSIRSLK